VRSIKTKQSTLSSSSLKLPHTETLHRNIVKWIDKNLTASPEYAQFQRKRLEYTIFDDPHEGLADFELPPQIAKQHAVVSGFLGMKASLQTLSQCEYYFRRFSFRDLPVSRADHLQNVCEFYFSIFYIIRSRIKTTLNNLKVACPDSRVRVQHFLQKFDKQFDRERRVRNQVHHHHSFDDIGLNRISLTGMFPEGDHPGGAAFFWRIQHQTAYRKFSKQWSLQAQSRVVMMQVFVEAVAIEILTKAPFLRFPEDTQTANDSGRS
jgi:hypothetical protein